MKEEMLIKKIYERHIKQLKNLSIPHKKLMICFSGIAGSGKTYISKILEKRYKGVRIRSDDIRSIVNNLNIKEIDKITYKYLNWLFENYSFKNKLIILDRGIDRRYQKTFSTLKNKDYNIFIVRLKVSRKLSEKRIIKKLGKLDKNYIKRIDKWIHEWKNFGRKVKSNIIIESEDKLDLKPLFEKLDKIVKKE